MSITIRLLCLIMLIMPFDSVVLVHHHYLLVLMVLCFYIVRVQMEEHWNPSRQQTLRDEGLGETDILVRTMSLQVVGFLSIGFSVVPVTVTCNFQHPPPPLLSLLWKVIIHRPIIQSRGAIPTITLQFSSSHVFLLVIFFVHM